jgi:hypothetical protein
MIRSGPRNTLAAIGVSIIVGTAIVAPQSTAAASSDERDREHATEFAYADVTNSLASAIAGLGRTDYRDIFSGVKIDQATGRVTVYATDPERAEGMVATGLAALSKGERDTTSVEITQSRYARIELEQAAAQVRAAADTKRAAIDVHSIVIPSDGRGLEVRTDAPQRADALSAMAAGAGPVAAADIVMVAGSPVRPVSRESPQSPYPGGIPTRVSTRSSGWDCTSAFGVRDASGTQFLLTAEHCYNTGNNVRAMNGNNIGNVQAVDVEFDAALIRGNAQSGVWVNDDYMFHVRSQQWSFEGEYVCQSGYTSYPNRCQIQIINDYLQYHLGDGKGWRTGVEGRQCSGCPSVAHGDSGGPVWSIRSSDGYVAARGVVSAGNTPVTPGLSYENIIFTEIQFITAIMGLTLQTS